MQTLDLPTDFDAVIGRLVLTYIPEPAAILQHLAARLRPGGILAFQEVDFSLYRSIDCPETPLMNQLVEWGLAVFERSGANGGMGLDLYGAFVDAGLPEPVLQYVAPLGGLSSWGGYLFMESAFRSLVPLMDQFGIAAPETVDVDTLAERLRAEVVASKRPLLLPPHVTAWAHLPTD